MRVRRFELCTTHDHDLFGARERDVEQVDALDAVQLALGSEQIKLHGGRVGLGRHHRKMRRCGGVGRPDHDVAVAALGRWRGVGPEQKHHRRFESLGTVDRHQAHRVCARGDALARRFLLCALGHAFEFVKKTRQTGEAPRVHIEREFDKGIEVGQHLRALMRRRGGAVARARVRLGEDAVEQIMHRQHPGCRVPGAQIVARAFQVRRQRGGVHQALPPGGAGLLRQFEQVAVTRAGQRAFEHVREPKVTRGRHQQIEQRGQIARLLRFEQAAAA